MKKILTTALFLATCVFASAQYSGEFTVSLGLNGDCGTAEAKLETGNVTYDMNPTYNPKVSAGIGLGYFPVKNLKIGLGFEFGHTVEQVYGNSTVPSDVDFNLMEFIPSMEYFVKLTDKFHYTPGIAASYGMGNYKQNVSSFMSPSNTVKTPVRAFGVSLTPASFECRINKHFAIGATLGSLNYARVKIDDNDLITKTFQFSADSGVELVIYL